MWNFQVTVGFGKLVSRSSLNFWFRASCTAPMSSSFSIFTARAKEAMGVVKRSVDEDVENATIKLALLERDSVLLRKTLLMSSEFLTSSAPRARAGMVDLMSSLGEMLVLGGTHYKTFAAVHAELDGPASVKLSEAFAKAVLAPCDEWIASIAELRVLLADLDKARVVYDHYKLKLTGLQDEKRALQQKGKIPAKDFEEKLARNAEKLKEVRPYAAAYHACAIHGASTSDTPALVSLSLALALALPPPLVRPHFSCRVKSRTWISATRRWASYSSLSTSPGTSSTTFSCVSCSTRRPSLRTGSNTARAVRGTALLLNSPRWVRTGDSPHNRATALRLVFRACAKRARLARVSPSTRHHPPQPRRHLG